MARRRVAFAHARVVAPMVGASDLAFRLCCRRHGADCAYTEMLDAARFAADPEYRQALFFSQLHADDAPLVVQFCGSEPEVLVAAARYVESHCDAVDFNLGCPQQKAREGGYGAFLLDDEHHERVFAIVRALASALRVPVCCKIRLLPTLEGTLAFARRLEDAGCALLAVHARERGSEKRRRQGPADLHAVAALKRALTIPVLTNGNVRRPSCVTRNLRETGADGAMVAEALLRLPSLFSAADRPTPAQRARASPAPGSARRLPAHPPLKRRRLARAGLALIHEYLALATCHPPPAIDYARAHVSAMLGRDGKGSRLRYAFTAQPAMLVRALLQNARSMRELADIADAAFDVVGGAPLRPVGYLRPDAGESDERCESDRRGGSAEAADCGPAPAKRARPRVPCGDGAARADQPLGPAADSARDQARDSGRASPGTSSHSSQPPSSPRPARPPSGAGRLRLVGAYYSAAGTVVFRERVFPEVV